MTKIEALKRALECATPGPMHVKSWHEGAVLDVEGRMAYAAYSPSDAVFISRAHNLMPALLVCVDAMHAHLVGDELPSVTEARMEAAWAQLNEETKP